MDDVLRGCMGMWWGGRRARARSRQRGAVVSVNLELAFLARAPCAIRLVCMYVHIKITNIARYIQNHKTGCMMITKPQKTVQLSIRCLLVHTTCLVVWRWYVAPPLL